GGTDRDHDGALSGVHRRGSAAPPRRRSRALQAVLDRRSGRSARVADRERAGAPRRVAPVARARAATPTRRCAVVQKAVRVFDLLGAGLAYRRPMPSGGRATHLVLVVEDDEDVREAMRSVLEDEGHRAATADNGQSALAVLRGGLRPCVVLLD